MNQPATRDDRAAFRDARILVTGGAGFIGRHLTSALLAGGAEVVVVDERPLPTNGEPRRSLSTRQVSMGSPAFAACFRQDGPFDYIFHLAARAYAADSVNAPYGDFITNLVATVDLLEQLRALKASGRLIFASSAAVYGNPAKLPVEESDVTVPISPYGVSKLAAERYVAVYARLYQLPAASLRLFSVYGPYQTKQVVYDFFAKLRASPQRLVVEGDGTQVRDLVYVADVVRAFLAVAARGRGDGFAYNVASGVGTSTADLAQRIIRVHQAEATIAFTGSTRPGDPERWVGSCEPLAALGGAPIHSLDEGLQATAHWFNTHMALQPILTEDLVG